jgi:hypothetical protein
VRKSLQRNVRSALHEGHVDMVCSVALLGDAIEVRPLEVSFRWRFAVSAIQSERAPLMSPGRHATVIFHRSLRA